MLKIALAREKICEIPVGLGNFPFVEVPSDRRMEERCRITPETDLWAVGLAWF